MEDQKNVINLEQFCARNLISKSTFFKLKREGRAPRILATGRSIRILLDDERKWLIARAKPSDTELRLIEREKKKRIQLGKAAATFAVASPKHISKRKHRAAMAEA